jgi:hypothetical protein
VHHHWNVISFYVESKVASFQKNIKASVFQLRDSFIVKPAKDERSSLLFQNNILQHLLWLIWPKANPATDQRYTLFAF